MQFQYIILQMGNEKRQAHQLEGHCLDMAPISPVCLGGNEWQPVGRITSRILGVKGLKLYLV